MKCVQILVVSFSFLILYTFPFSSGKDIVKKLESGLTITDKLKEDIGDVWCNGMNFTAVCQGWPELRVCYGEVIRAEFLMLKNDTSLYDYDKGLLGDMLQTIICENEKPLRNTSKVNNAGLGKWIFIIILLVLGFVFITKFYMTLKKYSNKNRDGSADISSTKDGSANEVSSTKDGSANEVSSTKNVSTNEVSSTSNL